MASHALFAELAALSGDPGRAGMMHALMDGRALTATELARTAGITPQTASGHLQRMTARRAGARNSQHPRLSDPRNPTGFRYGAQRPYRLPRLRTGPSPRQFALLTFTEHVLSPAEQSKKSVLVLPALLSPTERLHSRTEQSKLRGTPTLSGSASRSEVAARAIARHPSDSAPPER